MALKDELTKEQLEHLEEHTFDKNYFGFWVYLMTDLVIFGVLFATFAVLRNNVHGGIGMETIYDGPFVLTETMLLLTSSFTVGLAMLAAFKKQKSLTLTYLAITFLLGAGFLGMELYEFSHLFAEGHGFARSAFLSSFFSLVGTHGLHITSGLLWMSVVMIAIFIRGLTTSLTRKIFLLGIFWHFLDIVWIFIFTVVYLMGGL
jgi:cytochrome o ubiquinol oxidase subunit III